MAPDRHHFSAEFITARRDFFITDSETPAEPYCDDGRFHYVAHEHEAYFDWLYVVKGRLTETINGNDYAFGPGDLLWVRDGDWHEGSGEGLRYYKLCGKSAWLKSVIDFMQVDEAYQVIHGRPDPPTANVPKDRRELLIRDWRRCFESQGSRLGHGYAVRMVAMLFVDYFLPRVEEAMRHRPFPAWLRRGLLYIQEHAGESISSEQLADACGKSPEHVARSFRAYLKQTPSQYINQIRLTWAARLLVTTDMSVLSICVRTGFDSLRHFNRLFKERFNYPPRAFRLQKYRPPFDRHTLAQKEREEPQ